MNKINIIKSILQNSLLILDGLYFGYLKAKENFAKDLRDFNNAKVLQSRKVFKS